MVKEDIYFVFLCKSIRDLHFVFNVLPKAIAAGSGKDADRERWGSNPEWLSVKHKSVLYCVTKF